MLLDTARFGEIEINEEKIIDFPQGIPGFEAIRRFIVIETANTRPFFWLQAIDDAAVTLSIINPYEVLKEYSPAIPDKDMEELGITAQEDILVFNVVVIPEDIMLITANLAAPIVINVNRGCGRQILVDGKEYSVRHPVISDVFRLLQEESAQTDAGANP